MSRELIAEISPMRAKQLSLMKSMFKMAIITDFMDDVFLENKTLFRHKDKMVVNSFRKHYTAKYATVIEELFDADDGNSSIVLEHLKNKIHGVINEMLDTYYEFDLTPEERRRKLEAKE